MKRKFSIFLNVAVLALCVCAIAIGVYSAKTASLNVSGTVGFTAHNCDVDISGYIYGHSTTVDGEPIAEPTNNSEKKYLTYGTSNTKATETAPLKISGTTGELKFGDVYFSDMGESGEVEPIIIELTITNKSKFAVLLDDNTTVASGAKYSAVCSNPLHVLYIDSEPEKTTTLQYILRPTKDSNGNYVNISTPVSVTLGMSFSKIDTNVVCSEDDGWFADSNGVLSYVPSKDSYGSDTLIIPSKFVTSEGIEYDVTSLAGYQSSPVGNIVEFEKVVILKGPTSIANLAFNSDEGGELTRVAIPSSITSIGNDAFYFCSNLTSITIPSSVTTMGDAFGGSGLISLTVDANNETFDSRNNCNAVINSSTNTLISGCKNTVIPNDVTIIGNGAFYCCSGLTSITIPDGVTKIERCAFYMCQDLETVIIPSSVTSIGEEAFSDCYSLSNIIISEGLISIGNKAFYACWALTDITLPSTLISIGTEAFDWCDVLTKITIPSSVTSIGSGAFNRCEVLDSVTFATTTGWYVGDSAGAKTTALSSTDLANTETAKDYLVTTYVKKYWTR